MLNPAAAEPTPPTPDLVPADVRVWTWMLRYADRFRYLIFAMIAVLYVAGINGQWLMTPDSAIHLNVATNLAEAHTYATSSGMQERINPGLPWLLSAVFLIFGPDSIFQAKLVILLMSLANLAGVFWMFAYAMNRPTAVVMTTLVALSENVYQYSFFLLTDTPFALGLTLFLAGYARSEKPGLGRPWIHWALMAGGGIIMVAFRLVFVTFVLGFAAYLIIRAYGDRRYLRRTLSILIILITTLAVSCFADPRRNSSSPMVFKEKQIVYVFLENISIFVREAVFNRIPHEMPRVTTRAIFGVNLGNNPSIPFSIFAIVCAICLLRTHLLWGCIVMAFLLQWILFFCDSRYFLAVQALWVFAYIHGSLSIARTLLDPTKLPRWVYTMIYPTRWLPLNYSDRTLLIFLTLFLLGNVIRIGTFIHIQRSPDVLLKYESGQYKNLPEMGRFILDNTPPDAVVVVEGDLFPEVTTYLSKRRTISLLTWLAKPTPIEKTYLLAPISSNGGAALSLRARIVYPPMIEFARPHGASPWVLHRLGPR